MQAQPNPAQAASLATAFQAAPPVTGPSDRILADPAEAAADGSDQTTAGAQTGTQSGAGAGSAAGVAAGTAAGVDAGTEASAQPRAESPGGTDPDNESQTADPDSPAPARTPSEAPARTSATAGIPVTATAKPTGRATGLDGLRALAVLAVLAFHLNLPWAPGGFLGVDVFFVLSGFLITDLLVTRHGRDQKVGLRDFWIRRARRLLPALAVMLVVVTAFIALFEPDQMANLRPALAGAVSYTSNWWQAFQHQSYFDLYGPPPALQHLWSLAVEEQFYLLWPLLLVVVLAILRHPVHRAMIAWLGAVGSALLMLAIYVPGKDPSLVYYGTDTHASALMIGAAIALTWPLASIARASRPWRLDLLGLAGLALLGWAVWHLSGANPLVYPAGLVLAALAAGGVVVAAAAPGRLASALSVRPLRWIGVRSYGIYLWHWPVIAITTGLAVRAAASAQVRLIDVVVPIALAAASWRWLEDPILRNGTKAVLRDRGRRVWYAAGAGRPSPSNALPLLIALAVLAVTGVAGYGIVHRQTGPTLQSQIAAGASLIKGTQGPEGGSSGSVRESAQIAPWQLPAGVGPFAIAPAPAQRPQVVPGWKVLAIGDSVMLASAPELQHALPGVHIDAVVSRQMYTGVSIIQQLAADGGLRPVVIVGLGTNGTVTLDQIGQILRAIGHRWLILINTFVPRPWEQEVNSAIATASSRYPNVLMVNWHAAIENHTNLLWGDGIHPQPVGGVLYAKAVKAVVMRALAQPPVFASAALPPLIAHKLSQW